MAEPQVMPWEEYQSTPATGQGVVIAPPPDKPELPSPTRETERWRIMSPDEIKSAGLQEGQRYQINEAGKIEPISSKEMTEGEAKAVGFYQRMRSADTQLNRLNLDPQGYSTLIAQRIAPNFSRAGLSDERRAQLDAMENFIAASLRLESGAAIGPDEFAKQARIFFPQPGAGQNEIDTKRQQRELAILGFKAVAGESGARRADENLRALGFIDENGLPIVGQQPQSQQLAITGGERFSTDQDRAIAAAVQQAWASGADVQGLAAAAEAAGGTVTPADIEAFQQAVEARAQRQPVTFTPAQSGQRSALQQAAGEFLMTPVGTALAGAVNATGAGLLSQVAGDQIQGLEALNPAAGLTGEVIGSALGTAGLAKGAAAGLKAVAPSMASRLAGGGLAGAIGREALTEGAYGGLYAANTGEDIGTGIALGAGGSLAGRAVGAGLQRTASPTLQRIGNFLNRTDGGPTLPDGGAPPMGGGPDVPPGGGVPPAGGAMGGAAEAGVPPMGGGAAMGGAEEPFIPSTTTFRGGGAEGTSLETLRRTQAEGLPVPVELTLGAATRDAEQLAFEKEQLYGALGGPLRKRAEENNLQVLENFDRFIDETGATKTENIADSGNAVIKALSEGYKAAKNKVNVAYKRAEQSEGAQEPVSYAELKAYIDGQDEATKDLAPVLKSVAQQIAKNDPQSTGQITVATMENIRKIISKNAQQGTPSSVYGGEMKGIIDSLTEGKGGELYNKARKLRIEQARKFENRAIVARLVTNVKNMDDPKVAADEVFKKSIMNESPEDIKFLRQTLRTLGPEGRQAWIELQGATVRNIARKATANTQKTADDNPVVSADGLNKAINALDENGRLDAIFNPKMARQLRDLRDVVMYINTVPPGTSINSSGTARTVAAMFGEMLLTGGVSSYITGGDAVPVPIITGFKMMMKASKDREIRKKIARSLIPPETN